MSYLHFLPTNKKNVPDLITDPVSLIKNVRALVEAHKNDSPASAVTGYAVIKNLQTVKVGVFLIKHVLHIYDDFYNMCKTCQVSSQNR